MLTAMSREQVISVRQDLPQLSDLKKSAREAISAEVEKFLKAGGEIKKLPIRVMTVEEIKTNFNETEKKRNQPGLGKCLVNPRQKKKKSCDASQSTQLKTGSMSE